MMDSNTAFTNEPISLISKHFDEKNSKDDRSKDLETVKQNGRAIKYIKDPTPEMCLEAVKENGWAIKCIKDPTPEMCLEAVKQNGLAIEFIKDPTPEMCLEAVKNNRHAIRDDKVSKFLIEAFFKNN